MAQEQYGFFNSTVGDERSYDSADMAAAFHTLAASGVSGSGACLQVSAEGSTMRTLIGYGSAMVEGYYFRLRDDGGGAMAFEHSTEAELNRIDRIVIRLNLTARTVGLQKLIGTAAATPEAPALTRNAEVYELSLAQVLARAGAAEILPSDITDEREDESVCGLIAPEGLKQLVIGQMIEGAIELALDDEMADVLRVSAQTLETAEQAQARANIGAQAAIGASGMLKGDGAGGVGAGTAGTDYAVPVTEINVTLAAASWSGAEAPYTQSVTVSGMTAGAKGVSVGLPATATDAEFVEAVSAVLRASAQGAGSITIKAHGQLPTIDIPLLVQVKG